MLCQWLKCNEPAVIEWCEKRVCVKHRRAVENLGIDEARRVLNVDDWVPTRWNFSGVKPLRWPRNMNNKKTTSKAKPIF